MFIYRSNEEKLDTEIRLLINISLGGPRAHSIRGHAFKCKSIADASREPHSPAAVTSSLQTNKCQRIRPTLVSTTPMAAPWSSWALREARAANPWLLWQPLLSLEDWLSFRVVRTSPFPCGCEAPAMSNCFQPKGHSAFTTNGYTQEAQRWPPYDQSKCMTSKITERCKSI